MKLSFSSTIFNSLLKRLFSLASNDKEAVVTIVATDGSDCVEVYYRSKIDKTDSYSYLYDKVPLVTPTTAGVCSLLISNFVSLKLPDFVEETKYPHTKIIDLDFNKNIVNLSYDIRWSKSKKPSTIKLHYPLLSSIFDKEEFDKILNKECKAFVTIPTKRFTDSVVFTNFFKSDVSAKSSNGCYLSCNNNSLSAVGTDSNTAVLYEFDLIAGENTDKFKTVLCPTVLNCIKSFVFDTEELTFCHGTNRLSIKVGDRILVVPVLGHSFIVDKPDEFFVTPIEVCAEIELKPLVSVLQSLVSNTSDVYKRLTISLKDGKIVVHTDVDELKDLPGIVYSDIDININGEYFLTACQKMLISDFIAKLYFDPDTYRIYLVSTADNFRLVFLIQGLTI